MLAVRHGNMLNEAGQPVNGWEMWCNSDQPMLVDNVCTKAVNGDPDCREFIFIQRVAVFHIDTSSVNTPRIIIDFCGVF